MQSLQDRDEFNSNDCINVENFSIEESVGWNDRTELDRYMENKNADKQLINKLVQKANKALPLHSIIHKQNIDWIVSENQSGWTHKSNCPFPDHKDKTPSFGYNSKDVRFYCFGCRKNGGSVHFLSALKNKPVLEF